MRHESTAGSIFCLSLAICAGFGFPLLQVRHGREPDGHELDGIRAVLSPRIIRGKKNAPSACPNKGLT